MGGRKPNYSNIGQQFGQWTVMALSDEVHSNGGLLRTCICTCGKYQNIRMTHLTSGHTTMCKDCTRTGHFGLEDLSVYDAWKNMRRRCYDATNKAYKYYGERGITVCARWNSFDNFYKDMGDKPDAAMSLERVDNNLGYSPGNCIWATKATQSRNRRNSIFVDYLGIKENLCALCERLGISKQEVIYRLRTGLGIDEAILKSSRVLTRNSGRL